MPWPRTRAGRPRSRVVSRASPSLRSADRAAARGAPCSSLPPGAAVWRTENALSRHPAWTPSNDGIPSNAIGSLFYDPTDSTGRTVYAGTGEPNGSSDSEAGIGLFRSTDGGRNWSLGARQRRRRQGSLDRGHRRRPRQPEAHLDRYRRGAARLVLGERRPIHAAGSATGRAVRVDGRRATRSRSSSASRATWSIRPRPTEATSSEAGVSNIEYDTHRRRRDLLLDLRLRPLPQEGHRRVRADLRVRVRRAPGLLSQRAHRVRARTSAEPASSRIYVGDSGFSEADLLAHRRRERCGAACAARSSRTRIRRRTRIRLVIQLLQRAVLVRHARRVASGQAGRGLDRRPDAVRRDLHRDAAVERARGAAVDGRRSELHRHDKRHAVAAARDAPRPARDRLHGRRRRLPSLGSDGGVVRTSGKLRRRVGELRRAGDLAATTSTHCKRWLEGGPDGDRCR